MWAAFTGTAACVNRLVAAGADVDARKRLRPTPLHLAVHRGSAEIVSELLLGDPDCQAVDNLGNTASVYINEKVVGSTGKVLVDNPDGPHIRRLIGARQDTNRSLDRLNWRPVANIGALNTLPCIVGGLLAGAAFPLAALGYHIGYETGQAPPGYVYRRGGYEYDYSFFSPERGLFWSTDRHRPRLVFGDFGCVLPGESSGTGGQVARGRERLSRYQLGNSCLSRQRDLMGCFLLRLM